MGDDVLLPVVADRFAAVWNGHGYALAWLDGSCCGGTVLRFATLDRQGTLISVSTVIDVPGAAAAPLIAWTGSSYGIAVVSDINTREETGVIRVILLGEDGLRLATPTIFPEEHFVHLESLISTGTELALGFRRYGHGYATFVVTRVSVTGETLGSVVLQWVSDVQHATLAHDGERYVVAWAGAGEYAGCSTRSGATGSGIFFSGIPSLPGTSLFTPDGCSLDPVFPDSEQYSLRLLWTGSEFGLFHMDMVIVLTRLDRSGNRLGHDVLVGDEESQQGGPLTAVWTGDGFTVGWADGRNREGQIYLTRIACNGPPGER